MKVKKVDGGRKNLFDERIRKNSTIDKKIGLLFLGDQRTN